jgi:predicted ATPase
MKNLTFSVTNLGKIKKCNDIHIKDFTVFIGKNSSGKTWLAKLIYFYSDIKYQFPVARRLFEKKIKVSFQEKTNLQFSIEEQKKFLSDYNNVVKANYYGFIGVDNKESIKKIESLMNIKFNAIEIFFSDNFITLQEYEHYIIYDFLHNLLPLLKAHYLPAARANYMITYKYLFESQFNNFRNVLLKKGKNKKIGILPEIENNFLQDIYQVDTKNHKKFFKLAAKIEKNILTSGKLSIKNPQSQDLPTYEFKLNENGLMLDLSAASSAVTELSPLLMYFRYKISEGGNELLIIDEPELSLHPDAQRQLVEILVEAVNEGLKLILVTHSPFILEALNTHLQRAKIDDLLLTGEIKNFPLLSPEKTAAYFFDEGDIKNILDAETQLIDDKLLNSFNTINNLYDAMRDLEWESKND